MEIPRRIPQAWNHPSFRGAVSIRANAGTAQSGTRVAACSESAGASTSAASSSSSESEYTGFFEVNTWGGDGSDRIRFDLVWFGPLCLLRGCTVVIKSRGGSERCGQRACAGRASPVRVWSHTTSCTQCQWQPRGRAFNALLAMMALLAASCVWASAAPVFLLARGSLCAGTCPGSRWARGVSELL